MLIYPPPPIFIQCLLLSFPILLYPQTLCTVLYDQNHQGAFGNYGLLYEYIDF